MKKGFTLIELLAVIVILAIIALIATPIILNIINDSRDESKLISAGHYLNGVELALVNSKEEIPDGYYDILSNGNLCLIKGENGDCAKELEVKMDGEFPTAGQIKIENGVISNETYLKYNNYAISKNGNKLELKKVNSSEDINVPNYKTYQNGEVVYFDVTLGKSCTNYHEDNSKTGYNGMNPTGNQTNCLKFYAFLDNGQDTVNLLLDHNTTPSAIWSSKSNNIDGPQELLNDLYDDTKEWKGTNIPKNYDVNYGDGYANYTIEYSNSNKPYKARLLELNEITKIIGYEDFDGKLSSVLFFHDKSSNFSTGSGSVCVKLENGCTFGWLYDRTSSTCESYGCFYNETGEITSGGYWLSTASLIEKNKAWYTLQNGSINSSSMPDSLVNYNNHGVRPVIEVLKSNL